MIADSNVDFFVKKVAKKCFSDMYPELGAHFDEIWHSSQEAYASGLEKKPESFSFLDVNLSQAFAVVVIPFITGVFSTIVAELAFRKFGSLQCTAEMVKKKAKVIEKNMRLTKEERELADRLVPYIAEELGDLIQQKKILEKPCLHFEDMFDSKLRAIYRYILEDEELMQLLNHIENAHPNFTAHGFDHSRSVIANMERIVGEQISSFSPLELLILLGTALLHDVGMSDFEGKLADCTDETQRKALSKEIREQHAERSFSYITKPSTYQRFHIGPALARIIGVICKAHVNEYNIMSLKAKWGPIDNYREYGEIRVRLLAALLRLADALDLGYQRVKETLITVYNIPKNYVESIPHIGGALLITGVNIREEDIVVQAIPIDQQQKEWVRFLVSMLEEDFQSVKKVLKDKKNNQIIFPYNRVIIETLETQ